MLLFHVHMYGFMSRPIYCPILSFICAGQPSGGNAEGNKQPYYNHITIYNHGRRLFSNNPHFKQLMYTKFIECFTLTKRSFPMFQSFTISTKVLKSVTIKTVLS